MRYLGTAALPNATGIQIVGSPSNIIGGGNPGDANLISGNLQDGIDVVGGASQKNEIFGNLTGK